MSLVHDIGQKVKASHVEKVMSQDRNSDNEHLDSLDTIESTQSGKFAWLVSITASVGGLLFGNHTLTCRMRYPSGNQLTVVMQVTTLASSRPFWFTSTRTWVMY